MPINSFDDYPMTWKPILDREIRPLYRALAEQLERDIAGGALRPGTRLPPQRELADFLDINVSTVSKAFKVCELKGLLSSTTGSGTFVCFDALSNAYLLQEGNPDRLIDMGATMPEDSVNVLLLALLRKMLADPNAARWLNYNCPEDTDWQKDTAARLIRKCGYDAPLESILFSNGGQNALTAVLAGAFRYGDKIGVEPHTYPGVKTSAAMLGIQLVPIRQRDGEMDPEALETACKNDDIKGIYVIATNHNPTTHTLSQEVRKKIAKIARERNILIVEDGIYQLLNKPTAAVASFAPERSIYILSLSKAAVPGLRMAYLSVPQQYKAGISGALYNLNVSVSALMAELSARMIVSGQLERIMQEHRKNTRERNRLTDRYLAGWQCYGGGTCIFRWLLLPEGMTGTAFEQQAMEAGVQVYAAERFAVGTTVPACAVRLAVCTPKSLEELERGLVILRGLLERLN